MYIDLATKNICTLQQLRLKFPNISFPVNGPDDETLENLGMSAIQQTDMPQVEYGQAAYQDGIEKNSNGDYQVKWTIRSFNPDEIAVQQQILINYLANYRYAQENAGVTFKGKTIQTDRATRANWITVQLGAASSQKYTVNWKTSDGSFVTLNSNDASNAVDAVNDHVQKCFDAEQIVLAKISTFTTIDEVKASFDAAYSEE